LLRSQGIPARVAVGFTSSEPSGGRNSRLLVRVRNAHAWAEALLPVEDPLTKQTVLAWFPIDGTPSNAMNTVLEGGSSRLNVLADRLWLVLLRTMAYLQNIDKDRAKRDALVALVALLLLMNVKKIFKRLRQLRFVRGFRRVLSPRYSSTIETIYRRYEFYIERAFRETRGEAQTDDQLLERLRTHQKMNEARWGRIHRFIDGYRVARYGGGDPGPLTALLDRLEKDEKSEHQSKM
jgi:hypothetical protein